MDDWGSFIVAGAGGKIAHDMIAQLLSQFGFSGTVRDVILAVIGKYAGDKVAQPMAKSLFYGLGIISLGDVVSGILGGMPLLRLGPSTAATAPSPLAQALAYAGGG